MEKVRLWCGQFLDRGWLKNRTIIISVCLWLSFCQLDSTKNEGSVLGQRTVSQILGVICLCKLLTNNYLFQLNFGLCYCQGQCSVCVDLTYTLVQITLLRRTPASSPQSKCTGCHHAGSETLHQQNLQIVNLQCQVMQVDLHTHAHTHARTHTHTHI